MFLDMILAKMSWPSSSPDFSIFVMAATDLTLSYILTYMKALSGAGFSYGRASHRATSAAGFGLSWYFDKVTASRIIGVPLVDAQNQIRRGEAIAQIGPNLKTWRRFLRKSALFYPSHGVLKIARSARDGHIYRGEAEGRIGTGRCRGCPPARQNCLVDVGGARQLSPFHIRLRRRIRSQRS